jgi:hypothetical protein
MRAVLGVLLLLVGFTVAYLVLSGKFPAQQSAATAQTLQNSQAGQQLSISQSGHNTGGGPDSGPLGLPTMKVLHDYAASRGYA